jgi:hypothetical protein
MAQWFLFYSSGARESEAQWSSKIYPFLEEDKKLLGVRNRKMLETVWLIGWMCRKIKNTTVTFDPYED